MTREIARVPSPLHGNAPSLSNLNAALKRCREAFARALDLAGDDFLVLFEFPHSLLGTLMSLNGALDTLAGLASEPARTASLLEQEARSCCSLAEAVGDWGDVDAVLFMDDLAGNMGPLVSPNTLRALYFPRLRQIVDVFSRRGIRVIFHSDGDLTSLHRDILACGVAGHHPVEPVGNWNLRTASHREDVVVVGNAPIARLAQSPESAKAERDRCMAFASEHDAYFQAPASEIGPEIPLDHLTAFFS